MGFIRGSLAAILALGVIAGTAFAGADLRDYDRGKDVREEVAEPAPAPAPVAKVAHEHYDWHCAQGGGAHFNLPRACDEDDCRHCGHHCDGISEWDHRPVKHHHGDNCSSHKH